MRRDEVKVGQRLRAADGELGTVVAVRARGGCTVRWDGGETDFLYDQFQFTGLTVVDG